MVALAIGGRKSVVVAAFIVSMTFALSMFPTSAGRVAFEAEAQAQGVDSNDCESGSCGEIIMLEDFASPKHDWVEMNDPGT
jgi:hypothetical protein